MLRSLLARPCVWLSLLALPLTAAPAAAQTDYFWNAPTGGTGTWDTATQNWATASGGPVDYTWLNNGNERANFGDTAGTVTLGTAITAYGLNFTTTGYTVTGNTLTLAGAGGPVSVSTGNATISSVIAGSVGLTKTGAGTLTLTGSNTFTGNIAINGGVLSFNSSTAPTAIPSGSATVTLDGGTLRNTNSGVGGTFLAGTHPIIVGPGGGTLDTPGAATGIAIYSGGSITPSVAGTGTITKTGVGTLRLTSVNNTVQKLVVTGGLWQSNTDTGFGAVPASFLADAITLDNGGGISVNAGINLSANRGITLGAGGGVISTGSNILSIGVISGVGGLTKTGANTLTLNTAATYAGGTTITAGTIQLSAGNDRLPTTGNLAFTGGTLNLNARSQTINALSSTAGAGTITSGAAGNVTLTVGNGDGSGSFSGVIQNGSGTVALTKTGTGTQILTGANTYTGATAINGGALGGTGSIAGAATVASGARVLGGNGTAAGQTFGIGGNLTIADNGGIHVVVGNGGTPTDNTTAGSSLVAVGGTFDRASGGLINIDLSLDGSTFSQDVPYTRRVLTYGTLGSNLAVQAYSSADGVFALNALGFDIGTGWQVLVGLDSNLNPFNGVTVQFTPVPEPTTVLAVAAAGLGLAGLARRRLRRRETPLAV